ncbi:PcfJ domain-containing protein [Desemzia sp. C1]|uniref:PcfJ domain-containing protein n=1 Tax=Desemzia sp. C1 TaxID=2892016 RepID=UPI001E592A77|nr:PcfJ domain-containing protein [Desemzia sp. C1]MCI3027714.1 PcfJ domain-containing protein [Desemzia sp. C1]
MKEPKYYINHKLKPPKSFFDWCYSQIHTYKWSNKQKTILASDRQDCYVVEKRLTKRTNLTFFDKFYSFAIVLVTPKRIEIQSYCFWSKIEDGKQVIESELVNFEQFANNEHVKVSTRREGEYVYGLTPNFCSGGAYSGTRFYHNDAIERIKDTSELRYLSFTQGLTIFELENIYKYRKEIEFLQKINARKLADEVMYPRYVYSSWSCKKNVDMRTINEKWLRKNKPFFKNSDRSFREYELEKRIRERNGKVVPGIEEYLDYRDINKIPKGVGITRFQNWMVKNRVDFNYYLDYLSLLNDLNVALDSENLIIPKDLTKAHDNAVNLLNQMKREVETKEYEGRLKKILNYEATIDNFSFVVPKDLNELIIEGKTLHHCVGGSGYINQHKNGQTTIVFVRRKECLEEPFFTLELKNRQIVQVRGKHNQDPPEEVTEVADKWLEWINSRSKKHKLAKVGAA